MKLSLLVMTQGKQEGKLIEIKLPQFLIGRDPQCHLRPASPLISKRHCALIQKDGKAFIRDFDSTNGTFVNDVPIKGEHELNHDDELKVGPISFIVRLEKAPAVGTRTPAPAVRGTGKTPAPATKAAATTPAAKQDGKSSVSTPTPAPSSKPSSSSEDDDIAAMLLSDDGGTPSESASGSDGVPQGSTVFDMKLPPEVANAIDAAKGGDAKQGPKPASSGDTRSAAARILEKMTKRPRN